MGVRGLSPRKLITFDPFVNVIMINLVIFLSFFGGGCGGGGGGGEGVERCAAPLPVCFFFRNTNE